MRELEECRKEIDVLDRQIADLFEQRMKVCREIGVYKAAHQLPVLDAGRERELLAAKASMIRDAALLPEVMDLFETIMASGRKVQMRSEAAEDPAHAAELEAYEAMTQWKGNPLKEQRVLYQGQPGAYCEEAAMAFFGKDCDRMNLKTWDGVFRGIREGFGDYGVVPIENSSTGSISDVYDLLGRFGCYIVGESVVRVEHCLLACGDADLRSITDVYTHEQGFRQCGHFLEAHKQWSQHEMANTATAAKYVAEAGDRTKAAIASRRAAELYGLQILQFRINENAHNYTRFLVVAAEPRFPADADKISVRFQVPHSEGSLSRVLRVFARAGLNLEKLESRPLPDERWKYDFYADFTGNLRQGNLKQVIRELIAATVTFRVLGNYKAAPL